MIEHADNLNIDQDIFVIKCLNWNGIEKHIVGSKEEFQDHIYLEFSNLTDEMRKFRAGKYSKKSLFTDFDSAKEWLLQYLKEYLRSVESGEEFPTVGDVEAYIDFLREEIPKLDKLTTVELSNY